jgi:hypothetical protein
MAYRQIKLVAKSWKQQFFEVKDVDPGQVPKIILKPAKHGLPVKGEKHANQHSRTRD